MVGSNSSSGSSAAGGERAIEIAALSKRYRKLQEPEGILRSVRPAARSHSEELWALRNLDLAVGRGEILGVIGHNGAGKTTLLKLLAGVTRPTAGRIRMVGRIAPLISLGVGFHSEMSGRENVLVNGMLLGMSARQVADRFDSIVEFAELEEFIDTPVKFYSSGMAMRLGFAVIVHCDPQILLVDEVLAVGDAAFQLKCIDRLRAFQRQGATIVMVSHALHQMRQFCRRAILLQHGQLVYDGDVEQAIALHYRSVSGRSDATARGMGIEILERRIEGGDGEDHHANYDEPMRLVTRLRFHREARNASATFRITTEGGVLVMSSVHPLGENETFGAGEEISLGIAFRARLGGANYRLSLELRDEEGMLLGGFDDMILFVAGRPSSIGVIDLRARIAVDGEDRTDRRQTLLGV